jgi:hypothetical protein
MRQKIFLAIFLIFSLLFLLNEAEASTAFSRLGGHILLQVQAHGEAWYVNPANGQRYFLGRPADAFALMSRLSLGVSNRDFDSFSGQAPARLRGYILLKTEDAGRAYYVDPLTLGLYYLGRPADAFALMRKAGLGINNFDLSLIPIAGASAVPPGEVLNIVVDTPTEGARIGLPLSVSGRARVFENTLNLRLKNANNKILLEDVLTADSPDIGLYGSFVKSLSYPEPLTERGTLEFFAYSPKDGSEIEKVIINVRFETLDTILLKTYFSNSYKDPGALACATTYAVERRVQRTTAVGAVAINELLNGTTASESKQGFFSSINPGTKLNSLKIEDGVARVDFSRNLGEGVGGSCKVSAIRSQIESTLKQFPTVKSVVIAIEGETEEVLQP